MTNSSPINQISWTQKIVETSGRSADGLTLEQLRKSWWFNPLNASSMRLTREGVSYAVNNAKIQPFYHDLESIILPKTLLQLEKILEHPYFIVQLKKIAVFDEVTSLTLTLYDNDLQKYLDNVQKFN